MCSKRAQLCQAINHPAIRSSFALASCCRSGVLPLRMARSSGPILDLGEMIVMPGLINAHCHLDYTSMAGLFPPPRSFCDWIKIITTEKALWSYSDYEESW